MSAPEPGTLVRVGDDETAPVRVFMAMVDGMAYIRPVGGGKEQEVSPSLLRPVGGHQ